MPSSGCLFTAALGTISEADSVKTQQMGKLPLTTISFKGTGECN